MSYLPPVLTFLMGVLGFVSANGQDYHIFSKRFSDLDLYTQSRGGSQTGARPTPYPQPNFGRSAAMMRDFNADGYPDLLIGAPDWDNGKGRVDLISGKNGALIRSFRGTQPGAKFGYAVSADGDIDGDGKHDIVISAPYEDVFFQGGINQGQTNQGVVYGFSGNRAIYGISSHITTVGSGSVLGRIFMVRGETEGGRLGFSLDTLFSIDGDDFGELVLGEPGGRLGAQGLGRVYLLDGGVIINEVSLASGYVFISQPDLVLAEVHGPHAGSEFGWSLDVSNSSVQGTADFNLFIGAPATREPNPSQPGQLLPEVYGRAYHHKIVVNLNTGQVSIEPIASFKGEHDGDRFGHSVHISADMTGEHVVDLLIGAPGFDAIDSLGNIYLESGKAYLYECGYQPGGPTVTNLMNLPCNSNTTIPRYTKQGESAGEQMGFSVSSVLNFLEGESIVHVGAPFADYNLLSSSQQNPMNIGKVYVLKPPSVIGNFELETHHLIWGAGSDDQFGEVVTTGFAVGIGNTLRDEFGPLHGSSDSLSGDLIVKSRRGALDIYTHRDGIDPKNTEVLGSGCTGGPNLSLNVWRGMSLGDGKLILKGRGPPFSTVKLYFDLAPSGQTPLYIVPAVAGMSMRNCQSVISAYSPSMLLIGTTMIGPAESSSPGSCPQGNCANGSWSFTQSTEVPTLPIELYSKLCGARTSGNPSGTSLSYKRSQVTSRA